MGKIHCEECPYSEGDCIEFIFLNAKRYLTAIENEHKSLLRDMAVLVENLDKPKVACAFCKHYARRKDVAPCKNCVNNSKWRWDARPHEGLSDDIIEAVNNKFTKDREAKTCTDE